MSRKSERSANESRRIGAALVARIPAACRNALASFGRARHSPSTATPPFPRKIVFEALEPRVLLAADLPATTVSSASLDANHQQLLDPGSDQGVVVVLAAVAASGSEAVSEVEGNDTRITATALPLAEDPEGSGLLLGRGFGMQDPATYNNNLSDPDYWRIELQAGDWVSVSVDTPDSDVNAYVQLHNAADGVVASSNDEGPDRDAFISRYAITASGAYYVVVGHAAGRYDPNNTTTGSYELGVQVARGIDQENDANYSNNSISGANALNLVAQGTQQSTTIAGTLMASGDGFLDKDLFALGMLNAGNIVELGSWLPSTSAVLPQVSLQRADGTAVADEDGDATDGHFLATLDSDGQYYAQIEPGWTYGGHHYVLTDASMSWTSAEAYAQSLGGHLVTIDDAAEQQWLTQNFGVVSSWIGYTDQAVEGTWVWADGSATGFMNWAGGQPGSASYDYAYLSAGSWYGGADGWGLQALIELDGAVPGTRGAGPQAQYLLDVSVADVVPPRVESASLPADGTTVDVPVTSTFTVTLSETLDAATVAVGNILVWQNGDHFYKLTDTALNWTAAEAEAQALGGHLVTIDDAAEQQWLNEMLDGRYGNLWMGLSDQAVEGSWVWADGGAAGYTNWASGEPSNGSSSYDFGGMSSNGTWFARSGGSGYRGLIEWTSTDADGDGLPDELDPYPNDALNAWDLREAGSDGVFDSADDVIHRLTLDGTYSAGTQIQFMIDGGSLGEGQYRFSANSTLKDVVGNALDGNADGTGGDVYQRVFTVELPSDAVYEGRRNSTLPNATALPLAEDPEGSGLLLGRGFGMQDPATYNNNLSDPDYWRIELQAGDWVSVSVDTPDSDVNAYVQLHNAADGVVASSNDEGPDRDAFISRYAITASGAYYVVVGHAAGRYDPNNTTTGSYELGVQVARGIDQENDANYSNNSISGANALNLVAQGAYRSTTVAGSIMAAGDGQVDADTYGLGHIDAGNTVLLGIRLPYQSALRPIVEIYTGDNGLVSIAPNPSSGVAHFDVTTSGTYYARILAFSGEGARGQYLLDAAIWPTAELQFADLAIAAVVAPTNVQSGESVHFEWTVGNFGSAAPTVVSWDDEIVLSLNDRVGDADDILLGSISHTGALLPHESYTAQADIRLPLLLSGTYHLLVKTDHRNAVFENIFETNNVGESSSPITVSQTEFADLRASTISVPVLVGVAGESLAVDWTVDNVGLGATGNGTPGAVVSVWTDRLVLSQNTVFGDADDRLWADVQHDGALAAGESYAGTYSGALPAGLSGTYYVFVASDRANSVYEGPNTAPNVLHSAATVTVAPAPYADLAVSTIVAPASGVLGEPFQVQWTVANTDLAWGATPVADWTDRVLLSSDDVVGNGDDIVLGSFAHHGALARGETYQGSGMVTIPQGKHGPYKLFVITDSANSVFEFSHESNNSSAPAAITVTAADLMPESVQTPAAAVFGGPLEVSWTVRNAGDAPSSNTWSDRIWLSADDVLDGTDLLLADLPQNIPGAVDAGGNYAGMATVSLPLNVSVVAGDYRLIVQVDAQGKQAESDEINNVLASAPVSLTLPPQPDLTVGSLMVSGDPSVRSGALLTATWQDRNGGDGEWAQQWVDQLTIVNTSTGETLLQRRVTYDPAGEGAIGVGEVRTRSVSYRLPDGARGAGELQLTVVADIDNAVVERNGDGTAETNNVTSTSVISALAAYPDLAVRDVSSVLQAVVGSRVAVLWNVDNIGAAGDSGPWTERIYLSTDSSGGADDLLIRTLSFPGPLEAGGTLARTAGIDIPIGISGTRYVVVRVTSGSGQYELDSGNNAAVASQAMEIQAPDLRVTAITAPSAAMTGQEIQVTWTVSNTGDMAATGAWVDRVLLSTDNVLGNDTVLATLAFSGSVAAGESYTQTQSVLLPQLTGEYRLLVVTDPNQTLEEGSDGNNVSTGAEALVISAPYTATVRTDIDYAPNGTPVPLYGHAKNTSDGTPAAGARVTIRILTQDTRREYAVITDASGDFQLTFVPLQFESGVYRVAAGHPAETLDVVQDQFTLVGMSVTPIRSSVQLAPGLPVSGRLTLSNLSDVPLTGLTAVAQGLPANLNAALSVPEMIAGSASVELAYTFDAVDASLRQGIVTLQVTTAEGASLAVPINVSIMPLVSQLTANPGVLRAGVVRGEQTAISFTVSNTGGAASGDLQILLPDFPWLSLAQAKSISSIAPGQTAQVTLTATPAADLALGRYTGSIVLQGRDSRLSVGFELSVASTAVGDISVTVVDDYTFYVDGAPKVEGATVTMRDPYDNSIVVAQGTTDASGAVLLAGIPEGAYLLEVTAEKHGTSRSTYVVQPGVADEKQIFIGRETIKYSWQVVPSRIHDVYDIKLQSTFETDVPVPLVTIEAQDELPYIAPGERVQIDVILTNHGLIAAQDVELTVPEHPDFIFTPLVTRIGTLAAKTSMSIPVSVERRLGLVLPGPAGVATSVPTAASLAEGATMFAPLGDAPVEPSSYNAAEDVSLRVDGEFDPSRPTTVVIHGWNSDAGQPWVDNVSDAIRSKNPDRNVVRVDWSEGAKSSVPQGAGRHINSVGAETAKQLRKLYDDKGARIDPSTKLDFVGHSFGVYVSNETAGALAVDLGGKANLMTALDPASTLGLAGIENKPNTDLQSNFNHSVAYHSGDLAGTRRAIAEYDFLADSPYPTYRPFAQHGWARDLFLDQTNAGGPFGYGVLAGVEKQPGMEGTIDEDGKFHPSGACIVWLGVAYSYDCGPDRVLRKSNEGILVGVNTCVAEALLDLIPGTGGWSQGGGGGGGGGGGPGGDYPPIGNVDLSCDPELIKKLDAFSSCVLSFVPIPEVVTCAVDSYQLAAQVDETGEYYLDTYLSVTDLAVSCSLALAKDAAKVAAPQLLLVYNGLKCAYEIAKAYGFVGEQFAAASGIDSALGGNRALEVAGELSPAEAQFFERAARLQQVLDTFTGFYGSDVWVQVSDAAAWADWLTAFQLREHVDSDAGAAISEQERYELLHTTIPAPLSVSDIEQFIDRWNRSIDYWSRGIFKLSDVPVGQDTDFIAADVRLAQLQAAKQAIEASQAEGYPDLLYALNIAKENAIESLQGGEGVCAKVTIEIDQRAVITRNAFAGTLTIDNGSSAGGITGIRVDVDIRDQDGTSVTDRFGISGPILTGLTAVDGSGAIVANGQGSAKYTFIPNRDAAPVVPTVYKVSGTLRYISPESGQEVVAPLFPSSITVYPDAQLDLHYFQQRDVIGDDPFTEEIEPSQPFTLGLLVHNKGAGVAESLTITPAQPKIIENEKGLLVDFQIVGTQVGDKDVAPSLTADLGDLLPGQTAQARWLLSSTLQGRFIDYSASFEHVTGLGDPRLSLIDSVQIHELIHTVRADRPGDDTRYDFLVNDEADVNVLPDRLYLSDGSVAVVNVATATVDSPATLFDRVVQLTASMTSGWSYVRLPDPGADFELRKVVRSDGKEIRVGDNAWQTKRVFAESSRAYFDESRLHLLDFDGTGSYTLTYAVVDHVAPTITAIEDLGDVLQTTPVSGVELNFSEAIDPASLIGSEVSLTLDGAALNLAGLTLTPVSGNTYRLQGFADATTADGNYVLTVKGAGITDFAGNAAINTVSTQWAMGASAPVIIDLQAVVPALRNSAVSSLDVRFSRSMNPASVDVSDLVLTRNGTAVALDAAVSITQVEASVFRISGLSGSTSIEGDYLLTVMAADTLDGNGVAGTGQATRGWRMDTSAPAFSGIEKLASNPRNIVVTSLDVDFSEAIDPLSFDWHDITLTRDGGANLITDVVRVQQVDADTWRISGVNWVVGQGGDYELTVNGAGIVDLAGNAALGSVSESWRMDVIAPSAPTNLVLAPDTGVSDSDRRTNTLSLKLTGQLPEEGLTVRLTDLTSNRELAYPIVSGTNFSGNFSLNAPGQHNIRVRVTDAAGNVAPDSIVEVFVDMTAPGVASIAGVSPNPRATSLETLDVILDEAVDLAGFTFQDLALTRDGVSVALDGTTSISHVFGSTYRIAGLATFTAAAGLYQLTVSAVGLTDLAGNTGRGTKSTTWTNVSSLRSGISGFVYHDVDGSASFNPASYNPEAVIAGRTVFLDSNGNGLLDGTEVSTLSAANGSYAFENLLAGSYQVAQLLPAGWLLTSPGAGAYSVTLVDGQTISGRDFGNFQTATIEGVKFSDLDADGMRDADEPALAGWTIFLDANANGLLDDGESSVLTGADGVFRFTGIGPGTVQVGEVIQSGWERTTPALPYHIKSGFTASVDVGSVMLGSISGAKFNDLDGDGEREAGEPGIEGWTIFLDGNGNGLLDVDEVSTLSDVDGNFSFTALLPGRYTVAEVQRDGWTQTSPLLGPIGVGISTAASNISLESLSCGCGGTWATYTGPATLDYGVLAIDTALDSVGISNLRALPGYADLDGRGVTTVLIDTGIDLNHRFFGADQDGDGIDDRIVFQYDFANGDWDASDVNGHGSHIASLVASQDALYRGVAPGTDLIALKVFEDSGRGYFSYLEQALQWVLDNHEAYRVGVVNLSLGDGGNWTDALSHYGIGDELAALAQTDVIVVAAAGNNYLQFGRMGVAYPASDPAAIAVGATWAADFGGPWRVSTGATNYSTGADHIAAFSQRDTQLLDTFAPGARFNGADANGGIRTMQGTSQAAAFVSGSAALAQQIAHQTLGRSLSTAEFAALLRETGTIINDGDDEVDNVANTGLNFGRMNFEQLALRIAGLGSVSPGNPGGDGPGGDADVVQQAASAVHSVQLAAGAGVSGYDFGNFQRVSLHGQVFADGNGNGTADDGDSGLQGWTVFVDADLNGDLDTGEPSAVTSASGAYSFTDLGPGTYRVTLQAYSGYQLTTTDFVDVSAHSGADSVGKDFGVNRMPTALDDRFEGGEGQAITGSVADNDSDADGPSYTAQLVTGPAHGTLALAADGNFSFTPDDGWSGSTSFTYQVRDGISASNIATVSLTVTPLSPVNHAPTLAEIADVNLLEGQLLDLAAAGSDDDVNDVLTYRLDLAPAGATIDANTGAIVWQALDGDSNGSSYDFSVRVSDAAGAFATRNFQVNVLNVAPTLTASGLEASYLGGIFTLDLRSSDPGDDSISNWRIDWGDGQIVDYSGNPGQISHVYSSVLGEVRIRATASDEDGSYLLDPLPVVVLPQPLQVDGFSSDRNGFAVRFNDAFNASVINLYDLSLVGRGAADIFLTGSSSGLVKGSLVFDADYRGLRYQVSGIGLAAGNYSLTLKSGAQAFHSIWSALDGNADGLAGDDYLRSFSVAAASTQLSLPDFMRGPGQTVNVPAAGRKLPLSLRSPGDVQQLSFVVRYDPALLLISSSEAGADLPADATLDFSGSQPGELRVHISSPTPIAAGAVTLLDLVASVPESAPYGASQILDIDAVSVNGQALNGADDDALHVIGYLGDSDGNSRLERGDMRPILLNALNTDSGLAAWSVVDPCLVADVDLDGRISARDASRVVQDTSRRARGPSHDSALIPSIPPNVQVSFAPLQEWPAPASTGQSLLQIDFGASFAGFTVGGDEPRNKRENWRKAFVTNMACASSLSVNPNSSLQVTLNAVSGGNVS